MIEINFILSEIFRKEIGNYMGVVRHLYFQDHQRQRGLNLTNLKLCFKA